MIFQIIKAIGSLLMNILIEDYDPPAPKRKPESEGDDFDSFDFFD